MAVIWRLTPAVLLIVVLTAPVHSQVNPLANIINSKLQAENPDLESRLSNLRSSLSSFEGAHRILASHLFEIQNTVSNFEKWPSINSSIEFIFENVTEECTEHTTLALSPLSNLETAPTWALQMLDAWGKIPSGILSGHTQIPGDFNECLQIQGEYPEGDTGEDMRTIRGQYCSTYILPGEKLQNLLPQTGDGVISTKLKQSQRYPASVEEFVELLLNPYPVPMFPMLGTCFPSSCSKEDIQQMFTNFHREVAQDYTSQSVIECYVGEKPPFDAGDYSMIVVLVIIAGLCIIGTALDVLPAAKTLKDGILKKCLLSFSLSTNASKLLSTRSGGDNFGCFHGLRVLSIMWVVLGHTAVMNVMQLTWNLVELKTIYQDWTMYPVINATFAVDTFLTMAGVLVVYNLLKELDKTNGRLNYLLFVVHRYLRLTPTYIILVGVMATLLPYFGSGPMWLTLDLDSQWCSKNWWHNMLYISNLVTYPGIESHMCYGESWYLAVDMQLFVLSPLVIYPLWRWRRIGLGLLAILNVASVFIPAYITHANHYPPAPLKFIEKQEDYSVNIYIKPWMKFGPYVVGMLLGYLFYLKKRSGGGSYNIPYWMVAFGWTLSTGAALALIYGPMRYFDPENTESTLSSWHAALYAGMSRYVWGVVIAWTIFACVNGYGGIVNSFLCMKMFIPLGRLTFCMYISSYHIQMVYHLGQTHPSEFTKLNLVYIFFAHLVASGSVALLLTVTLESPFIQLEKILFSSQLSTQSAGKYNPKTDLNVARDESNDNNNNDNSKV